MEETLKLVEHHVHPENSHEHVWMVHGLVGADGPDGVCHPVDFYVIVGYEEHAGFFCTSALPPSGMEINPIALEMGLGSTDEDGNPCLDISFPNHRMLEALEKTAMQMHKWNVATTQTKDMLAAMKLATESSPDDDDTMDLDKLFGDAEVR